jgi:hypothetical protein
MKTIFNQHKYPICTINRDTRYTVASIHHAILNHISLADAAKHLGLKDPIILSSHLGKFILNGEILNFASFKALSVENAKEIWGARYKEQMIAPEIRLRAYSAFHIYQVIRHTSNIREAACHLGIRDHSLDRLLAQCKFENKRLFFRSLKDLDLTASQLRKIFKDVGLTYALEQRINLTPDVPVSFWGTAVLEHNQELDMEEDFDTLALAFAHQFQAGEERFEIDEEIPIISEELLKNSFFEPAKVPAVVEEGPRYFFRPRKNRYPNE